MINEIQTLNPKPLSMLFCSNPVNLVNPVYYGSSNSATAMAAVIGR